MCVCVDMRNCRCNSIRNEKQKQKQRKNKTKGYVKEEKQQTNREENVSLPPFYIDIAPAQCIVWQ